MIINVQPPLSFFKQKKDNLHQVHTTLYFNMKTIIYSMSQVIY